MEINIRDFTEHDFLEYDKWFKHESISSALEYIDQEWLDSVLNQKDFKQICIFKDNTLLAVCGIYLPQSEYNYYAISDFSINPDYQHKGYGSKILNKIINSNSFNESDCWKALVSIQNVNAINFFKKNGWNFECNQDNGYSKCYYFKTK